MGSQTVANNDEFWNEIQTLFNEYEAAVHERRESDTMYVLNFRNKHSGISRPRCETATRHRCSISRVG